jgi:UDP-N-acetylmuramoyl-L-alanyl-D-glutamate--2,6-diaminopimelate ligase
MTIVGVTGTDGKTTTASILYHMLKAQGLKVALISTVSAVIDGKVYDTGFHVSTPDGVILQSYIKKAREKGVTHLVLEVTSHSIDQHRIAGIHFTVGVLTNISREHLDYHKTMAEYTKTKVKLLNSALTAVLNKDDDSYEKVQKYLTNESVLTYGLSKVADINPHTIEFKTALTGDYNKRNILAALTTISALSLDMKKAIDSLSNFVPPKGRSEVVYNKGFTVIIDFAHTPGALRELFSSLHAKGKIIHVFGCAGKRDVGKRPLMGEVSNTFADHIVLTSEDPRGEDVKEINKHIKKGVTQKDIVEIVDRQEAINHAILIARAGDIVVITGKGHEESLNIDGHETFWSEHKAVNIALNLKGLKAED